MKTTNKTQAPAQTGFSTASGGSRGNAGSQGMQQRQGVEQPPPTEAEVRSTDLRSQSMDADAAARDASEATRAQDREDAIRQAAYQRYLQRGGEEGGEVDDWLEAERQLSQGAPEEKR